MSLILCIFHLLSKSVHIQGAQNEGKCGLGRVGVSVRQNTGIWKIVQNTEFFTTRTPAVTDVFDSGRNEGALRPARRVGFWSLVPGLADDIFSNSGAALL